MSVRFVPDSKSQMSCKFGKNLLMSLLFIFVLPQSEIAAQTSPYPQSSEVTEVTFDWSTHNREAPGSDNWPITWADNDHQYTSWGDGGGFRGTNSDGRVSLGFARVEGSASSYKGVNVWGGKNPENPATFKGKSYGVLSVAGVLYKWVSPLSGTRTFEEAKLYKSTNHGASWQAGTWKFLENEGMILPTFLQFGMDYQGAKDNFVYIYANHLKDNSGLKIQIPGEIALMRVSKTDIMNRSAYEFFAGLDGQGGPTWTQNLSDRQPVFENPNGVGWNTSVSYNSGVNRYFLMTEHDRSGKGSLGLFDAPKPWGPWTTVFYTDAFGASEVEATTFFWNFSTKWLSADGKDFVLIFSGSSTNDSWNTVEGSFTVGNSDTTPPDMPKNLQFSP